MTLRGLIQRPWQVRAFLAGRRTQVRVPVPNPGILSLATRSMLSCTGARVFVAPTGEVVAWMPDDVPPIIIATKPASAREKRRIACPLGTPGDVLAIRETWAYVPATAYRSSTGVEQTIDPDDPEMAAIYRAGWELSPPGVGWRSPATMPLRLARLRYRVLDIRAHSVQEISEESVKAEGVAFYVSGHGPVSEYELKVEHGLWSSGSYRLGFEAQWEAEHGPGSWERDWCFAATVEPAP